MLPSNHCEYKTLRAHSFLGEKIARKLKAIRNWFIDQDEHKVSLCNKRMKATLFPKDFSRAQTKDGDFHLPAEEF